jgi:putative oxidoreductase
MVAYYPEAVPVLLRVILGVIFVIHGWPKIKDFDSTKKFVASMGFVPAGLWAFLLAVTEFFGGILLLAGFATRIISILLIFSMLVALYMNIFVWKRPFKSGWELDLLIIICLASVLFLGSGAYSIDSIFNWKIFGWNLG